MDTTEIIRQLHESEINGAVEWFFDGRIGSWSREETGLQRGRKSMRAPKPDFVFIREIGIEQSNGLMLAGTLITNIPKFRAGEASETEKALVVRVIDRLTEEAAAYRLHPEINCIWLDDSDGPIPDAASLDRWKTVYVDVVVRIAVRAGEGVKLN